MTLLLFLASLALVNYIISRPPKVSPPASGNDRMAQAPKDAVAEMPGLLALGEALEQHGRGQTPQPDRPIPVKNVTR